MPDPDWWKKAVFYQIYPRSFFDTSGNGIGDLKGIIEKLDYLSELGIDGLWISPFFQSPMADYGYDVSDYRQVDPLFGSNEDFDTLLTQAHNRNIKIIIDMVLGHTSTQHLWFQESRENKTNPKADWYIWSDDIPNNWVSVFGGPAWEWDEQRKQYYFHNWLKEQADLNYHNPDVRKAMMDECRHWLEKGVDGLRLDVINFVYHDKELRDNPIKKLGEGGFATQLDKADPYNEQWHIYDKSRPEALEFTEEFRAMMNDYPQAFTLAEIGDDKPTERAAEYVANNKRFHTAYSFSLMTGNKMTSSKVKNALNEFFEQPGNGWPSWAFCNHDIIRSVTKWGLDIQNKISFVTTINKLLLCLRGTPFIYQGDELGLPQAELTYEQLQDPWGKAMWPEWHGRDGCRTPIPWDSDAPQAGFSSNPNPWLPVPEEHKELAVSVQEKNPNSILNQTRSFIKWRKTKPALQLGEIEFIETDDEKLLVFKRTYQSEEITCLFNLSEEKKSFNNHDLGPLETKFIEKAV